MGGADELRETCTSLTRTTIAYSRFPLASPNPWSCRFGDIHRPTGVAVDSAGTVYAMSYGVGRVAKLAVDQHDPLDSPFKGWKKPWGVAVDNDGYVYVADHGNRALRVES